MFGLAAVLLTGPILAAVGFLISLIYLLLLKQKDRRAPDALTPRRIKKAKGPAKVLGVVTLVLAALSAGTYWMLSAAVANM